MITRAEPGARPLIVVLGASGFIGSALLAALAPYPVVVRAVARRPVAPPRDGVAVFEVVTADLTDPGRLTAALSGAHAVVHLLLDAEGWRGVGTDPGAGVTVGVMRQLVEVLPARCGGHGPPAVVFAGSVSQVGPPPWLPIDGSEPDRPATAYDRQKQAAEDALKQASVAGLLHGVSVRLPTVFGPVVAAGTARDRGVVSTMIRRALAGESLTMWHDGRITRELLYVHDVAAALVAAVDHADVLAGRHWPVGRGRGEPLGEVFHAIAALVAERSGRSPVPVICVPPPADAQGTDFHSMAVDPAAFSSITGWRAAVPLREGLMRTVAALAGS
ncbi:NAD-dependent epimerase/dehydratase family protein [Polymorphospora sp. NPDC051019]|uniref:NAD-dependent epimerase/dehydratase family protein n=1 Tax=Polymorphospora sp. NPDC051019 TaxID=3155725 RepID=UPI00341E8A70